MNIYFKGMNTETAIEDAKAILRWRPTPQMVEVATTEADTTYEKYQAEKPQLFSNESNAYLRSIIPANNKGGNALMVAGSMDLAIDCCMFGINDITAVDLNRNQFYVGFLKLKALQKLTYEQFNEFLVDPHSPNCMALHYIREVLSDNDELTKAVKAFWEYLFETFDGIAVAVRCNCLLFEQIFLDHGSNRVLNFWYIQNEEAFENAKRAIGKANIKFLVGDILNDVSTMVQEKFKYVMLSNLHDFVMPEVFTTLLNKNVFPYLKRTGTAVCYVIQLRPEWIKTSTVMIRTMEINPAYAEAAANQIKNARNVVARIGQKRKVSYVTVPSGKGFGGIYSTPIDTAVIIRSK